MGAVKLSKRTIDRLTVERASAVFWDSELPGFGIRVHATGRKVFVAQARTPGGLPKRATVGRYRLMEVEDARLKAAEMIDRIRRGRDPVAPPAPEEPTVADLAARFLEAHVEVNCK
ncbi:MAG: Arm DNA-binding domain-containing protein, partial [Rhodospirillaceae bacterium]|nr:Arm DNA-binding domain-containing protein [Rhodospirillaceae bacterium]